jgi:ketosteroid isomerase-like protein
MLTGSIRRSLEAFNRRDWDVFMHLYRDDSEFIPMPGVGGDTPGLDIADRYVGATGVREFFAAWEEAWEVFEADPQEVIDFGDSYLILLRLHGRARGSGLEIDQNAGHLYRWRRGMIGRAELYGSREQALAAVGLGRRG